jgi:RRXRR protein/HNH endonuclease
MVFVLDRHKKPLMPCTPRQARLLLAWVRAVVHRVKPFVIRLRDRSAQDSVLNIDPVSRTTGMTLVRTEERSEGEVLHALFCSEVCHRGQSIHRGKQTQRHARRHRRSANLRHRAPHFDNQAVAKGWLPPSLPSQVGNSLTWTRRYGQWVLLSCIEVERVRFDTQLLQNPDISGLDYQHGERVGWEARAYLLLKYAYRCVLWQDGWPFELDHIRPRSRGGSNRISNLALACHACNMAKGNQTAHEFGHPEVEASARRPLKDAAAVNERRALSHQPDSKGLPARLQDRRPDASGGHPQRACSRADFWLVPRGQRGRHQRVLLRPGAEGGWL